MTEQPVALVTGGNRGLGLAICEHLAREGYAVGLSARATAKAEQAADSLSAAGTVFPVTLDVSDTPSVRDAVRSILERHGRIDVLINNAGIYPERDTPNTGLAPAPDLILETLNTNTVGPYRLIQAVLPLMRDQGYGRIVNVSSQMARLAAMPGSTGSPGYRISKTALNGLTALVASELGDGDIKVNAADPGWVRTDMGGATADRAVPEGIDTIVWLATLPADGPTGGFFRDRQATEW